MTQTQAPKQDAPAPAATQDENAITPHELRSLENAKLVGGLDILTVAKAFAQSGMFADIQRTSQAVTKIIAGHELGIPPFASMQGFHAIPRKRKVKEGNTERWVEEVEISMSANLRAAIVRRDPDMNLKVVEQTAQACEVAVAERFAGKWEDRGSVRYTIEEARNVKVSAGQGQTRPLADGPMWKNYPADMLFAAVMRRISKRFAPHLFIGERIGADDNDLVDATQDAQLEEAIVDGELIEEHSDPAPDPVQASTGDEGAGVVPSAPAPEVAEAPPADEGPQPQPPASESLFDDDTPPPEDAQPPLVVGLITVPPAPGGPHKPAEDTVERIKSERIKQLRGYMSSLSLTDGALEHVWRGRYGFDLSEGGTVSQGDALEIWLTQQGAKPKGSK